MEPITTPTARTWLDDEGIIHIVATGVASTADSNDATLGVVRELLAGSKAPVLFDIRRWPSGDASFWRRFIQTLDTVCIAGAFVLDPHDATKVEAFASSINSLLIPFRVFSTEDEALAFLRSQIPG